MEIVRFLYKTQKSKKTFDFSSWTEYNMSIFIRESLQYVESVSK